MKRLDNVIHKIKCPFCPIHSVEAEPGKTICPECYAEFGFDDDQWLLPVAPETTKHDPEKTVFCSNLRPFLMTFPDGQLLAERKVFQSQVGILLGSKKHD